MSGLLSVDRLVDAATVIVGAGVVVTKVFLRKGRPPPDQNSVGKSGADFLNGSLIVPFFTMLLAVGIPPIHQYLMTTSAVSIALAGGIGIIFVIGELWRLD
jgi:hypothetical protein